MANGEGKGKITYVLMKFLASAKSMAAINFPLQTIPFLIFKLKTWRKAGLLKLLLKLA